MSSFTSNTNDFGKNKGRFFLAKIPKRAGEKICLINEQAGIFLKILIPNRSISLSFRGNIVRNII